jgi:hypothetical protein
LVDRLGTTLPYLGTEKHLSDDQVVLDLEASVNVWMRRRAGEARDLRAVWIAPQADFER